jgi:O-antigen ligase
MSPRYLPGAIPVIAASLGAVVIIWVWLALSGGSLSQLASISPSVRLLATNPTVYLIAGLVLAGAAIVLAAIGLRSRPSTVVALLAVLLVFGDARMGVIQQGALFVRYALLLVMTVAGALTCASLLVRGRTNPTQKWLIALLVLGVLHLVAMPVDLEVLMAVPALLMVTLGVPFGVSPYIAGRHEGNLGRALTVAAVVVTAMEASSLALSGEAFVGGRFRAWHQLPTGFAINYVMFVIVALWASLGGVKGCLRLVAGFVVVFGVLLLGLSGTRSAMAAFVVVFAIMLITWRPKYMVPVIVAMLVVGAVVTVGDIDTLLGYAGDRITTVSSRETRFAVWALAWDAIRDRPWWGYGLIPDVSRYVQSVGKIATLDAHNSVLGTWIRFGVVGALVVVVLYAYGAWMSFRSCRESAVGGQSGEGVLFAVVLLAVIVTSMFEDVFAGRGNVTQMFWALSLALLGDRVVRRPTVGASTWRAH